MLKSDVLDLMAQILQVPVKKKSMTQCNPFSGLHPADGMSLFEQE